MFPFCTDSPTQKSQGLFPRIPTVCSFPACQWSIGPMESTSFLAYLIMPFPSTGEAQHMLEVFGLPEPSEHAHQQASSECKHIGSSKAIWCFGSSQGNSLLVLGVGSSGCSRRLGSLPSWASEVSGQIPGLDPNAEDPPVSPQRTPSAVGTTCLGTAPWITVSQESSTCC